MKRLMFFLVVALFAGVSVAGVKYIAVVETEIDAASGASASLTSADVRLITAELRREAVKHLPRSRYNIITAETVQSMGGSVLEECAEENCVIALGAKIGADYIARGTISKYQNKFTLTVEIYETNDGTLMASSDPVRSENPAELLELAGTACADMFKRFASEQLSIAPAPVPAPEPELEPLKPESAPVSAEPKPAAKKPAKAKPAPAPPKPKPVRTAEAKTVLEAMDLARGAAAYLGAPNPAFAYEEDCMSARYLFGNTFESFYTQEIGFSMPLGYYGAAGAAWIMNGGPKYEATDADGHRLDRRVAHGEQFIALTYAGNVWEDLAVGGDVNIIAQSVADIPDQGMVGNYTRFGFGLDVGLTYKVSNRYIFGLSMNNIFNTISDTDEKYPAALRFSLLSDFWNRRICYGADFALKDIFAGSDDYLPGFSPTTLWEFNHKAGVNIWRAVKLYGLIGFDDDGVDHYGFAVGARTSGFINLPGIRDIEAMMQFVSVPNPLDDASRVTFYVRVEFGKHREEIFVGN